MPSPLLNSILENSKALVIIKTLKFLNGVLIFLTWKLLIRESSEWVPRKCTHTYKHIFSYIREYLFWETECVEGARIMWYCLTLPNPCKPARTLNAKEVFPYSHHINIEHRQRNKNTSLNTSTRLTPAEFIHIPRRAKYLLALWNKIYIIHWTYLLVYFSHHHYGNVCLWEFCVSSFVDLICGTLYIIYMD